MDLKSALAHQLCMTLKSMGVGRAVGMFGAGVPNVRELAEEACMETQVAGEKLTGGKSDTMK